MNDINTMKCLSHIAVSMAKIDSDYSPVEWLAILLLKTNINTDEVNELTDDINEYLVQFPGVELQHVRWDAGVADSLLTYFDHSVVGELPCDADTISSFMFNTLQLVDGAPKSRDYYRLVLIYGWRRVEWMNLKRPNGESALTSILYQTSLYPNHPYRYRSYVPDGYYVHMHRIVAGALQRHMAMESNMETVNRLITEALSPGMDTPHAVALEDALCRVKPA